MKVKPLFSKLTGYYKPKTDKSRLKGAKSQDSADHVFDMSKLKSFEEEPRKIIEEEFSNTSEDEFSHIIEEVESTESDEDRNDANHYKRKVVIDYQTNERRSDPVEDMKAELSRLKKELDSLKSKVELKPPKIDTDEQRQKSVFQCHEESFDEPEPVPTTRFHDPSLDSMSELEDDDDDGIVDNVRSIFPAIAEGASTHIINDAYLAQPSGFSCFTCGGANEDVIDDSLHTIASPALFLGNCVAFTCGLEHKCALCKQRIRGTEPRMKLDGSGNDGSRYYHTACTKYLIRMAELQLLKLDAQNRVEKAEMEKKKLRARGYK